MTKPIVNEEVNYVETRIEADYKGVRDVRALTRAEISDTCRKHFGNIKSSGHVQAMYGVLTTFTVGLFTTEFRPSLGLTAACIKAIYIIIIAIMAVYVLIWNIRNFKKANLERAREAIVEECMSIHAPILKQDQK